MYCRTNKVPKITTFKEFVRLNENTTNYIKIEKILHSLR